MTWFKDLIKELRITNSSIYLTSQRITSYDETLSQRSDLKQHRSVVGDVERNWHLSALHRCSYNWPFKGRVISHLYVAACSIILRGI